MAITRDDILDAAVRLLDQDGLEGLSLRKIAAELGVSAPTLYWHVESKRELLDLLAVHLMRQHAGDEHPLPAEGQHWTEWLAERSRVMFAAMTRHRDAPLIHAGNRPPPDSLPHVERVLSTFAAAGIAPGEALQILFAVNAYVGGSALEWQGEAARVETGEQKRRLREAVGDGEDYPLVMAAVASQQEQPHDAPFELGLALLIDGLRARYPG